MTTKIVFPPEWGYSLLERICDIVSEGVLRITPKQVELAGMDLSHIVMLSFKIPKAVFTEYDCKSTVDLGLNFNDIKKIVFILKKLKEPLELVVNDKDKMVELKAGKAKPRLSMIDVDGEKIETASIESMVNNEGASHFTIGNGVLKDALDLAQIYGEIMQFKIANNKLVFSTIGNLGDMEYEVVDEDFAENQPAQWGDEGMGIFANNWLGVLIKFIELGDQKVGRFTFKESTPLIIQLKIAEQGEILIALAPRVEEDDANLEE